MRCIHDLDKVTNYNHLYSIFDMYILEAKILQERSRLKREEKKRALERRKQRRQKII